MDLIGHAIEWHAAIQFTQGNLLIVDTVNHSTDDLHATLKPGGRMPKKV